MKRAPICASVSLSLVCGLAAAGTAQSTAGYQPVRRAGAGQAISAADVRIAPTTMAEGSSSIDIGGDHWNARGFDLKTLIAQIYDVDLRLVEFAGDDAGDARYDVTLNLPREIDEDAMQRMLEQALEKKFGLAITPERRTMDVYVLTAPNGPGAALHRHRTSGITKLVAQDSADQTSDDAEQITYLGKDCEGVSSGGITASAGTIGEFRRTLEPDLDRLLVDETGLKGNYDFQIGNYANQQELFQLLRTELGIVVTPAERQVTVLAIRPAGAGRELRAAM